MSAVAQLTHQELLEQISSMEREGEILEKRLQEHMMARSASSGHHHSNPPNHNGELQNTTTNRNNDDDDSDREISALQNALLDHSRTLTQLYDAFTRPAPPSAVAPQATRAGPPQVPTTRPPARDPSQSTHPNPNSLSVMTINLLYEAHYAKYASGAARLPAELRAQLTSDFILSKSGDIDVFALQECDVEFGWRLVRQMPEYSIAAPSSVKSGETVAILYNNRKLLAAGPAIFTRFLNPSTGKPQSKGFLKQLFEVRRDPLRTDAAAIPTTASRVCVVCAHVPFDTDPHNTAFYLYDMLYSLPNDVNRKYVVCGDFNAVRSGDSVRDEAFAATICQAPHWQEATHSIHVTSRSPSEVYAKIDYVFFTTNRAQGYQLVLESAEVEPKDVTALLPHENGAQLHKLRPFFSDHAAVTSRFRIAEFPRDANRSSAIPPLYVPLQFQRDAEDARRLRNAGGQPPQQQQGGGGGGGGWTQHSGGGTSSSQHRH